MEHESTNLKKRNIIFFDTEFSGLHWDAELLQIGAIVVSQPDFKIQKKWEVKIKPERLEQADPRALEIVGYSDERWQNAIDLKTALEQFNEIACDGILCAYNIVMDFMHLKKAFARFGIKEKFHWQVLDVLTMAYDHLYNEMKLTSYRTGEVTEFLGINSEKHHDAFEDAMLAYKMFMKLTGRKIEHEK